MSKRTTFTTLSPLPIGISREVVIDFLHNHQEMIDLNPLVTERHPIKPPPTAPQDELDCVWYSMTDKISYGLASSDVSYTCAFHDLPDGIQTHCRAPLGVDIRDRWTLCGTLPGEPPEPVELGIGAPGAGVLYIREDVDLRCNLLLAGFVKKNLKRSHATLVEHLVAKTKSLSGSRSGSVSKTWSPTGRTLTSASAVSQRTTGSVYSTAGGQSPPPRLGSPFIVGYQPGRGPSFQYQGSETSSTRACSPPSLHHSRPSSNVRAQYQQQQQLAQHRSVSPPSTSSTAPPPRQHYSLPPASQDPSLYPKPLRVRNSSVGSSLSGGDAPRIVSNASSGRPSTASGQHHHGCTPSQQHPRKTSSDSHQHPEYPHLTPYTGGKGDETPAEQTPKTPVFIAELAGPDTPKQQQRRDEGDNPNVVKMQATLNGPFVAELE